MSAQCPWCVIPVLPSSPDRQGPDGVYHRRCYGFAARAALIRAITSAQPTPIGILAAINRNAKAWALPGMEYADADSPVIVHGHGDGAVDDPVAYVTERFLPVAQSTTWHCFECPSCHDGCWVQGPDDDETLDLVRCWSCNARFWASDASAWAWGAHPSDATERSSAVSPGL